MITVDVANGPGDLDEVRALMRVFVAWHRERHIQDVALIDEYFDPTVFGEELASLPGPYSPPDGLLLLARLGADPAGCVALRRVDEQACEMKRMFVYPRIRGKGVGHALAREIIERARRCGYRAMRLDTSFRQSEAIGLYRRLGFSRIDPYYELPADLRNWLVFMEFRL